MKFLPLLGVLVGVLPEVVRWCRAGFTTTRPDSNRTRL